MPAKILVVDDEPDLQSLIMQKFRKQIRSNEFEFVFAENGLQALDKVRDDQSIDLVLSDINMPEMDGLTLLSKLNEADEVLKSVIVSAYGDMDNIRTAMNRGAFDFLTKPIDLNDLDITIRKTLDYVNQLKERLRLQEQKMELERRNDFIRQTFGRYVATEVMENLLESPDALELGGERRNVSILMSDLRGFSSISERFEPEKVVSMLNRYFEAMVDIIMEYGGTINEFIGDAILVIFGAPVWIDDHAERAVACAVAMQLAMAQVNEQNRSENLPELEMGIGIDSGEVVAGNVGSEKRTKYGIVGSHVNLTSRIESYTVGGQVLVSESTVAQAGDIVQFDEEIEMSAKGFTEPISVYNLKGIAGDYALFLPDSEDILTPLNQPLTANCTIMADKHATDQTCSATIVALSTKGMQMQTDHDIPPMTSLKIRMSSKDGEEIPADLYGKVLKKISDDGPEVLYVRFTSLPLKVTEFIRTVIDAGSH